MAMKTYLVGGAVRDAMLGLPVGERDWVVVGASSEELTRRGYHCVGRHFPVFLHPETHEEYALARRETKTGPGYRGFAVQANPGVSLETDLQRRDLTINAMARGEDGVLVDPFAGAADLRARILRHVSDAFAEDPVRVLRLARFAARFQALGFRAHPSTLERVTHMARSGELDALVPERVWQELRRALIQPHPEVFFQVLSSGQALAPVFPELVAAGSRYHDGLSALRASVAMSASAAVRLAALLCAALDAEASQGLALRLRLPGKVRDLLLLATRIHADLPEKLTPRSALALFQRSDALRQPQRFQQALLAVLAARGVVPPRRAQVVNALRRVCGVNPAALLAAGHQGADLARELRGLQLKALQRWLANSAD